MVIIIYYDEIEQILLRTKLVLLKTDLKKYWTEIRRLKDSKQVTSETAFEGKSDSKDIADAFAAEYDKLYSFVTSDPEDLLLI